jgi:hypothetical protein
LLATSSAPTARLRRRRCKPTASRCVLSGKHRHKTEWLPGRSFAPIGWRRSRPWRPGPSRRA